MMRNWNRREFTRNVGMLTLFAPFIRLLEPSLAHAQANAGPAKYLLIVVSNGPDPALLQPGGGQVFSEALAPLRQIANDAVFLNQFDSKGTAGNHAAPGGIMAANYIQRESLDHFVAGDLRRRGIVTQVPSLHLGGVRGQQGISFRNNGLQVPQFDVSEAFRTIFDGTAPPPPVATPETPNAPMQPAGPSETTIRLLRRQSVLDAVRADISQLERAFNGLEREKLQLHIQSIQELESRIAQQLSISQGQTAPPVGGGSTAPQPSFVAPVACDQPNNRAGDQAITNSAIHLELAMAAFACDITRVALVEFGHHQKCDVNIPGAQGDWHNDFMHSSTDRSRLRVTEQFMSTQIVNAVNRLKALPAPDGAGSLYDQTFILWAREMGDAVIHAGNNMPFVVAGGAGGYLGGRNRYLQGGGAFHLRVLMNAAEAMGVRDLSGFGDPNQSASDRSPFDGLKA
jgi:hypothetical protein